MGKPKKEPKRKPKYGLLSCVGYIYRYLWKNERRLALHGLFTVIITVAAAAVALYGPQPAAAGAGAVCHQFHHLLAAVSDRQ